MTASLSVLGCAARLGWADFRATYTWRVWLFGWVFRLLAQAAFYGTAGRYLGSAASERYVVVGNCVAVIVLESLIVVVRVADERAGGTLPLLVAAPAGHLLVYLGRGVACVATGFVTSTAALTVVPAILGVGIEPLEVAAVLPVLFLIGASAYCYGCALAAIVVRYGAAQWLVLNAGYIGILAFCGVNAPTGQWPEGVQTLAAGLPLTHGLQAIRGYFDGGAAGDLVTGAGAELAVGCGWLAVAVLVLQRMADGGRREGSLEFGE
ncbi:MULTISPECIES: ABC transporter permease [unclassified Streptomyces]|uniref:ABC transporter permease n=1 Tax=unclassified Streptomyces TaxID=2593676 RepID=UPI002789EA73|nr:ABC transporter permease [Streptomyces sp. B4I13]MDQ0958584.1 ABC-2 type transport system permease protein [Streptomyces sp. B4I13]